MKSRCPDEETIADYMEGHLSPEDRDTVEAHLSDCEVCLEILMLARHLETDSNSLESEVIPDRITRSAVQLVAELNVTRYDLFKKRSSTFAKDIYSKISGCLTQAYLTNDLVLVRGGESVSENCVRVRKNFKDTDAEIEIEKAGENKAHIRVRLMGDEKANTRIRVTLKKGEREISSLLLDENYALFEGIPFDHYHLIFFKNGAEIGTYSFGLTETGHGSK